MSKTSTRSTLKKSATNTTIADGGSAMAGMFVNPYTDFGFKKLFGEEGSKDLLIDFLNQILPSQHQIASLSFKPTIQATAIKNDRSAIYDIYCESPTGQKFIVEMQQAGTAWFKDRMLFYSTFPIQEQAVQGVWNFELTPVYCVAILNFSFDKAQERPDYLSRVQLKNLYCEVFTDKLNYIFIEMPRFNKQPEELSTHFEKWLYFLKHLEDFNEIPAILQEPIFAQGFNRARLANLNRDEMWFYQHSLKILRDNYATLETARLEGEAKGIAKGEMKAKRETARGMVDAGIALDLISKITGLSAAELQGL
jgi:predicted transposase/invertase (TIGR01784 family)